MAKVMQAVRSAAAPTVVFSAEVLHSFFDGSQAKQDQDKIAGFEKSRMHYLIGSLFTKGDTGYTPKVDSTAVTKATAEYVKSIATQVGWKGGKGAGKRPAAVKSALNRAGDVKALFGAVRWTGVNPEGKGYQAAISESRESLEKAAIKWDGTKIPDAEGRKLLKLQATAKATASALPEAAAEFAKEHGRLPTDEEMQEMAGNATSLYAAQTAWQGACNVVVRMGSNYAENLAALIPQAINAVEAAKTKLGEDFGKDAKLTREAIGSAPTKGNGTKK